MLLMLLWNCLLGNLATPMEQDNTTLILNDIHDLSFLSINPFCLLYVHLHNCLSIVLVIMLPFNLLCIHLRYYMSIMCLIKHLLDISIHPYRFSSTLARIKTIISRYSNNLDMELQQRAIEYVTIFSKHDNMR